MGNDVMTMVHVFHAEGRGFRFEEHAADEVAAAILGINGTGSYHYAGTVEVETETFAYEEILDAAYAASNSVTEAWKPGERSTSVGDLLIYSNRAFEVAGAGFKEVKGCVGRMKAALGVK